MTLPAGRLPNASDPVVSVVVPARNESDYLPRTLTSLAAQETDVPFEVIVVDGDSDDGTPGIAIEWGARLVRGPGDGIGAGRHRGAKVARGSWLAFVDADTVLDPAYLETMLGTVEWRELAAASSRCRIPGLRAKPMELTINHIFPRLDRPILPGFNFFVDTDVYEETGGFPNVANEDTAYSRQLGERYRTGYGRRVLVETSPRRIEAQGLLGMCVHYLRLDWQRLRSGY